jgi:hypothetical protein
VFWSRDPDGTQHNQGDSFHTVNPGINGTTSREAIRNADGALALIEATLKRLQLYDTTDIVVAADHGFSTIVKTGTDSPSVKGAYKDVKAGELPLGFLAIDLYSDLKNGDSHLKLFDPDAAYREIDWMNGAHPARGNGLIGDDPDHPQVVVVANGGSDLIYLPAQPPVWQRGGEGAATARSAAERRSDRKLAERIVNALLGHDYVSGVFVDNGRFGEIPGTLSTEVIGVGGGRAVTPHPDIVVNFSSKLIPGCTLKQSLCAEEVADTSLMEGQGMHGSFSRADTWNFMAARGPDFRSGFVDELPASNADIGMTMAELLNLTLPSRGTLKGRVLTEALTGRDGPSEARLPQVTARTLESKPTLNGLKTVLKIQALGDQTYLDAAGVVGRTVGLDENERRP